MSCLTLRASMKVGPYGGVPQMENVNYLLQSHVKHEGFRNHPMMGTLIFLGDILYE